MYVPFQISSSTYAEKDLDVPLTWLFQHSPILRLVSQIPKLNMIEQGETKFVNNIRTFAQGVLDVRFIVDSGAPSSTRSSVAQPPRQNDPVSIYEVRRSSYASWKDSSFAQSSKAGWDDLTLYVVSRFVRVFFSLTS